MTQINIFLEDKHDNKLDKFAKKWNLSKYKTIRKIIEDYVEKIESVSENSNTVIYEQPIDYGAEQTNENKEQTEQTDEVFYNG